MFKRARTPKSPKIAQMPGAEAASMRQWLGYTRAELAALLEVSASEITRRETAKSPVPSEHATYLRDLVVKTLRAQTKVLKAARESRPPSLALPREGDAARTSQGWWLALAGRLLIEEPRLEITWVD